MDKKYHKFYPIFGHYLKVGFETTFPKEAPLFNLDPSYGKNGLIHDSPEEKVKRVYEPAFDIVGSCEHDKVAQVSFKPINSAEAKFRRLIFTRKRKENKPWCWMLAARHGEFDHFGFDSWNSRDERYLPLAYPGTAKYFIPTYFKIQHNGEFVYVEIMAWGVGDEEESGKVVIQGKRVAKNKVPKTLHSVVPDNGDHLKISSLSLDGLSSRA